MPVKFKPTEEWLYDDVSRAIFRVIEDSLRSSVASETKAAKIADELAELCDSLAPTDKPSRVLFVFFTVLVNMVEDIPSDHPWQDVLAQAIVLLQERPGDVGGSRMEQDPCKWADMPGLTMFLQDLWAVDETDPTNLGGGYKYKDYQVMNWKRRNSFVARLSSAGFMPAPQFPAVSMYDTFENHPEDPEDKTALDCRVWVATEWLLRAGPCVWDIFCGMKEEETERGAKTKVYKYLPYPAGPLASGIPEQGVQKWEFWQSRLLKFADNWDQLFPEGADTTHERIMQAVHHMDSLKQACS